MHSLPSCWHLGGGSSRKLSPAATALPRPSVICGLSPAASTSRLSLLRLRNPLQGGTSQHGLRHAAVGKEVTSASTNNAAPREGSASTSSSDAADGAGNGHVHTLLNGKVSSLGAPIGNTVKSLPSLPALPIPSAGTSTPGQAGQDTVLAAATSAYNPDAHKASSQRRRQKHPLKVLSDLVKSLKPLIETALLVVLWYASNIMYNIYNKQVLQIYPHAMTCTLVHIVVAIALMATPVLLKLKPMPKVTTRVLQAVIPLSMLHLAGFLTTNMSLGAVNVSLTHTIKSLEPFFTVMLTFFLYGTMPAMPVMLTLLPIVAGVVVASATDLSFNWYGFVTAMGSNLAFQSRNVISKRYMTESSLACLEGNMEPAEVLNETDLFLGISVAALPLAIPVMLAWDGPGLVSRVAALGGSDLVASANAIMPADVLGKTLIAGVCRTADVFASYGLLSRLNPVTHSVANCVKRVVVIAVSILFFNTKSSYLNIIGTVLALGGVFAYSMAERMPSNRKKTESGPKPTPMATQITTWMQVTYLRLVPGFLTAILRKTQAEKAEKASLLAAEEEKKKIEPDYFL